MTTTINNDLRVFMLAGTGWHTQQYFCNMEDLAKCAGEFEINQPYNIYHFWNSAPKRLSHNKVIEILEANQIDASFFKKPKRTKKEVIKSLMEASKP